MIKVALKGPWAAASQDFRSFANLIEDNARKAISQEALFWAKKMRSGIRTQKSAREARPPWPPLAASTLAAKKPKTKMLIDIGTLMRAIISEKVADMKWLVGVKRGAKTKGGESLVNVAAVHELGASVKAVDGSVFIIPKRQFVAPVAERLAKKLKTRLMRRFNKEMSKYMKHKNMR